MTPDVIPLRPGTGANPPADPPTDPDGSARLIDREELARRLSIGVSTLDRLRATGKIGPRAIKCGGVRFQLAEVAAWLSIPDRNGELYDAKTWPTVWAAVQKKAGGAAW